MYHLLRSLFIFGGLTVSLLVHAESGVTSTEIKLGQSAAFTGPTAVLGTGMREGLLAAFAEINATGGVHGRKINLVAKDDGYEPERARANVTDLISKDDVFLIIGGVGTPTAMACVPVCEEAKVPFLAPFTGALRRPYNPFVIHLRASYEEEVERLVRFLVD
jgi:branched-chain amino acid transport system substrate-binding protein